LPKHDKEHGAIESDIFKIKGFAVKFSKTELTKEKRKNSGSPVRRGKSRGLEEEYAGEAAAIEVLAPAGPTNEAETTEEEAASDTRSRKDCGHAESAAKSEAGATEEEAASDAKRPAHEGEGRRPGKTLNCTRLPEDVKDTTRRPGASGSKLEKGGVSPHTIERFLKDARFGTGTNDWDTGNLRELVKDMELKSDYEVSRGFKGGYMFAKGLK
jgi:hypothetical protein